ncbi:MAG: PQQ-binding-like beta-propeller repeat protein [Pirellulaceae bacterium]|nr:PQQ-binding-like beta-propeller repeat protein [Pirellulaceae bacterium]MDP7016778.1 PQQ-binding-like beta-propeller repeat protein [Pirellulaceae bacterium]
MPRAALCLSVVFCLTITARAENWPQWRGPHSNGVSSETNLPIEWEKEDATWRLPLPGPAGSTPVIWDERIFLTSVDKADNLLLLCVGVDGKEQWRRVVSRGNRNARGDEGNSASPSPSTDGKLVWTCMANGALACYTVDGERKWAVDLQERYGKYKIAFGMSATPVLDRGRLYVQLIHGEGKPSTREAIVVALEAATGKEIWKHQRDSDARAECEHSYASPMLYRHGGVEFLLTHGADYVIAHDLADGSEIWRCGELNPKANYNPTLRFVASPVCSPNLIVVPSAKNGPVFGIKPKQQGDITELEDSFAWKRPRGTPDVPSPLVDGDLVYLCRENGNLVCLDAASGDLKYEERTTRGRHRASPVLADGKIYLTCRENGTVTVVAAGTDFDILAQNKMGEAIAASPAIANGRIYLRSFDALYAIGK